MPEFDYTLKQLALLVDLHEDTVSRYIRKRRKLYGVVVKVQRPVNARGASYRIANESYEKIRVRLMNGR